MMHFGLIHPKFRIFVSNGAFLTYASKIQDFFINRAFLAKTPKIQDFSHK